MRRSVEFTLDAEVLRLVSASLPAIVYDRARPWNGRVLSGLERWGAYRAALAVLARGESQGMAALAAHKWLSEHAP